ncbi:acyl-coenzyme A thioesterase 1-like [Diadema setosum]|uniref:acyl-coenzyme A thioesterase 1-like n=1 Tax=Diadema setosum TaxID=31175 RepID=UPI003B3BA581
MNTEGRVRDRLGCLLNHLYSGPRGDGVSSRCDGAVLRQCSSRSQINNDITVTASDQGTALSVLDRSQETHLHVHAQSGLSDELLDIRVSGLEPGQEVTLRAYVMSECGRYRFESSAQYVADRSGRVAVQNDPSIGGSYTGVEPHGLLWSMVATDTSKWPRLIKKNIQKPFVYHFRVVDVAGRLLGEASAERWSLADYVDRIPLTHGKAKGCLYLPQQKGNTTLMPVLIDIRGGVPYLIEDRPSLLASHGFATISVDYFRKMRGGADLTSSVITYFDMQIFLDIIDFIREHPRLDINRVGIVSACLGGYLAMNAVARIAGLPIKCLSVTGSGDVPPTGVGLVLPDGTRIIPPQPSFDGQVFEGEDGLLYWTITEERVIPSGEFVTPVEDINIPMLFLIPGDDRFVSSLKRTNRMLTRLQNVGKHHLFEAVFLRGTGHIVDVPYLPLCRFSNISPGAKIDLFGTCGGDPKLHSRGQEVAWRKTINWFRHQLGVTEVYRTDWLDSEQGQ